MLLISDDDIHWIVSDKHPESQGIASVTIKQAEFSTEYSTFTLYGLVSFDNCTFGFYTDMFIYRSQSEPEPSEETMKTYKSYITQYRITLTRCNANVRQLFFIRVVDAVREIHIVQCKIEGTDLNIAIVHYRQSNTRALARVVVENSTMLHSHILVGLLGPATFGFIEFSNVHMNRSEIRSIYNEAGGLVSFLFENCTFDGIDRAGLYLRNVVQVKVRNSMFSLVDDAECEMGEGCVIYVKGLECHTLNASLVKFLFFPTCESSRLVYCQTIHIENSVFVGSGGSAGSFGGVIRCDSMNLDLINSQFTLTEKSKPAATGGFIHFTSVNHNLIGTNVTFNASAFVPSSAISIMAIDSEAVHFTKSQIICPGSLVVDPEVRRVGDCVHHHYQCKKQCQDGEYSYDAGTILLQGKITCLGAKQFNRQTIQTRL